MLGMRRPFGLVFLGAVLMLLQPRAVAAKKKEAKKSHGDLAQDAELVNGNPWALLIDAGSGGSRLHLYEWEPRVYHTLPPPISKPFTSEVWTERMQPGISTFAHNPKGVGAALVPLLAFAKAQLASLEDQWATFPIYLKATAGMRELPLHQRMPIMLSIRAFLANATNNPFLFDNDEMARVISGEEEAAYAWAGVNLATGALLATSSWGTGAAAPTNAYGTLEMGGASSQVAFYQPEQSIVENLFKLQIGGSKHWNIYAHSFLQYGRASARSRMWSNLAEKAGCFDAADKARAAESSEHGHGDKSEHGHGDKAPFVCYIEDACLAVGASSVPVNAVTGVAGVAHPFANSPWLASAVAVGQAHGVHPLGATPGGGGSGGRSSAAGGGDDDGAAQQGNAAVQAEAARWDACLAQLVLPLGFNKLGDPADTWCLYSHLGQCSFAGVYQPSLPDNGGAYGSFVLIGGYVTLFKKLGLPLGVGSRVTLRQVQARGAEVCALDKAQLEAEFGAWPDDDDDDQSSGDDDKGAKKNRKGGKVISLHKEANVAEVCFLSAFAFAMLHHGHGFDLDRNFTAVDTMDYGGATLSVGWQLGAVLYEVNTLPYADVPLAAEAATEQAAEPPHGSGSSFPAAAAAAASLGASLVAVAATLAVARSEQAPGAIGLEATRKEKYMSVRLAV